MFQYSNLANPNPVWNTLVVPNAMNLDIFRISWLEIILLVFIVLIFILFIAYQKLVWIRGK